MVIASAKFPQICPIFLRTLTVCSLSADRMLDIKHNVDDMFVENQVVTKNTIASQR